MDSTCSCHTRKGRCLGLCTLHRLQLASNGTIGRVQFCSKCRPIVRMFQTIPMAHCQNQFQTWGFCFVKNKCRGYSWHHSWHCTLSGNHPIRVSNGAVGPSCWQQQRQSLGIESEARRQGPATAMPWRICLDGTRKNRNLRWKKTWKYLGHQAHQEQFFLLWRRLDERNDGWSAKAEESVDTWPFWSIWTRFRPVRPINEEEFLQETQKSAKIAVFGN